MEPQKEARPNHVLNAYRERRRHRRGEDTYFGSVDCIFTPADDPVRGRRFNEIVEAGTEAGMPRELAEKLYVVAEEEGLDPDLGYALVESGLGVCPPAEGLTNTSESPTTDKYLPEWILPPIPPDDLLRERRLRMSFRRLRALLAEYPEVEGALHAFADEPDVDYCGY